MIQKMIEKKILKNLINRIYERIIDYHYNTCESVDPKGVEGFFNDKCFFNACQYAQDHNIDVVMGICIDMYGFPCLHFWCVDNKRNKKIHFDPSLGYTVESNTYYPLKIVKKHNYQKIGDVFSESLEFWTKFHTNPIERMFLKRHDKRIL